MNTPSAEWEREIAALWTTLDARQPQDFIAEVQTLASRLEPGHPVAAFEQACAFDSTGHSDQAAPLYRQALAAGLKGLRRRRAVIQLASSLRNLGRASEAEALLAPELAAPSDELDGAVRGFLALALVDLGREREAVAHSLLALSGCLPRYNGSLARYARALVDPAA